MSHFGQFLRCLIMAIAACAYLMTAMESVAAEGQRTFFDKLFGRKKPDVIEVQPAQNNKRKVKSSSRNKNNPKKPAKSTAPAALPKSPQAKRILVIGDFIAAHVAEGLTALYANNPNLVVIKETEAASGLVRDDHYSWPAQIGDMLIEHNPDMILVALGANDRQSLRLDGEITEYGTPSWNMHYLARVERLAAVVSGNDQTVDNLSRKRVWAWLGLPPFQKAPLNSSALVLNVAFEEVTKKQGGHFIDIWRGFVDDQGRFNMSGYDARGQLARLRTTDGINFTASGRLKLAFYANEAVITLLDKQLTLDEILTLDEAQGADIHLLDSSQAQSDPIIENITYHPPQPLLEIPDGMPELIGPALAGSALNVEPLELHRRSLQPGRADYFLE